MTAAPPTIVAAAPVQQQQPQPQQAVELEVLPDGNKNVYCIL